MRLKPEVIIVEKGWRASEALQSIFKLQLAMNCSVAFHSDGHQRRSNKSCIRQAGRQTSRSGFIDRLPLMKIALEGMQRSIFRHGVKITKILCKNPPAVVHPYADSLRREAAVDNEIQVVISIHVHGGDRHAQSVGVCEGEGT